MPRANSLHPGSPPPQAPNFLATLLLAFLLSPPRVAAVPKVGGCNVFPANNAWNIRVDKLPVHKKSAAWVRSIGLDDYSHADFGSGKWDGGPIGIPFTLVNARTPRLPVSFYYPDESDRGPYPVPARPAVEYGSDHHVLLVDTSACMLYEIYDYSRSGGKVSAGSGAIFNLSSNKLRPATWTSADAAGLPILPGLARYGEVQAGAIRHALRFTAPQTQKSYVWPARHFASDSTDPNLPPMGIRVRLKKSFNTSAYPRQTRVVLEALKIYGMMLADNGSPWYISGAPNAGWDNDDLHSLQQVLGRNYEVVDMSSVKKY
eukprot:TRINITY_DN10837_c0_g3_i1.p1 TRINITY_DN10837_c0_g3~~TRINITY_DN10837_c0_g3_i1.p1  ORF type:complete len:317 (-),score=2.46 TRINITY_DN10837_c0_g3_i1:238-1188(-)